jgi:cyanate permease
VTRAAAEALIARNVACNGPAESYTLAVRESPNMTIALGLIALAIGITARAFGSRGFVLLLVGTVTTCLGVYRLWQARRRPE